MLEVGGKIGKTKASRMKRNFDPRMISILV
jgi:hypothetical protein